MISIGAECNCGTCARVTSGIGIDRDGESARPSGRRRSLGPRPPQAAPGGRPEQAAWPGAARPRLGWARHRGGRRPRRPRRPEEARRRCSLPSLVPVIWHFLGSAWCLVAWWCHSQSAEPHCATGAAPRPHAVSRSLEDWTGLWTRCGGENMMQTGEIFKASGS